MASEAQIEANRANAQKSTGPRTPEGKAKVAQNAIKHGLFARETVIRGEDEDQFEMFRLLLLKQLTPDSPLEEVLGERVVDLSWRLKRAAKDQSEAFAALYEKYAAQAGTQSGDPQDASAANIPAPPGMIGRMILEDFSQNGVLERLLRYERRIENSLLRTLKEMRGIFDQRQKAAQEVKDTLARWKEEDWEARKARMFAPRPPVAVSEEVSSVKCQVSRPPSGVSSPGNTPTSNSTPQTSGGTPAAQDKTCKTNPICSLDKPQVLGGNEVTRNLPQGGVEETRPQDAGYRPVHCVGRPAIRS